MSSMMCGMLLGAGVVATKTYVDDVFSTYVYTGSSAGGGGSGQTITNGIDLSGEGGLVWLKSRTAANEHSLSDTVNGAGKHLQSQSTGALSTTTESVSGFTSSGFTLPSGWNPMVNASNQDYTSWTFRKSPGFFDVVKFTTASGQSGNQRISHSLGCVPGLILVKNLDASQDWFVYHRSEGRSKYLELNETASSTSSTNAWGTADPTSTDFGFNSDTLATNYNVDYVAYLFAGGEEGYNSVEFDGTNDYLSIPDSTDYDFGTGDFTIEAWVRYEGSNTASTNDTIIDTRNGDSGSPDTGWIFILRSNGKIGFHHGAIGWQESTTVLSTNTWYHVAVTRNGNDFRVFINGTEEADNSHSGSVDAGSNFRIGYKVPYSASSLTYWNGKISNLRIVKGTAVYTSSFTTPTAPLTNITNTKLLCCNGDIATSSTVTPGTITASGSPNTTGTSPFTSADAVFGDAGDQNVIKCGSYVGNGSDTGPEINLGWEPQWILLKRTDSTDNWPMYDVMRGITTDGTDNQLRADQTAVEHTTGTTVDVTSTGFKITTLGSEVNANNGEYIYMCIRRPDGYVGKPPELGTDVFAMDTGAGSSTVPGFDSGFTVDLGIARRPASGDNWYAYTRLHGTKYLRTDTNNPEGNDTNAAWDSSVGWYSSIDSTYQSWMWKRHAGFDVVHYIGNGTAGRQIPHNLSKTPEMIWVKTRSISTAQNWMVGHKGLNGGTNPWEYYINLNTTGTNSDYPIWNDLAPTSTHFNLGTVLPQTNNNNETYTAFLFASVEGISKVGYYTGNGSTGQTITLGFAPRFVIIRRTNSDQYWTVLDTVRGWDGTNDPELYLNYSGAQNPASSCTPTSNGFTLSDSSANVNNTNDKYIYYAHA